MANVTKIVVDKKYIGEWLRSDSGVREILLAEGHKVASEARSTASSAENGAGGKLDGYAGAGFSVDIVKGRRRQYGIIQSNADPEMAKAVHFYTQRRDGIGHLRAALYKFTNKLGVTKYPIGKNYKSQPPRKK
jgi:hypothetical protein